MQLPTFKLEDYFVHREFTAPYLLCASDVESWSLKEILAFADPQCADLWDSLWLGYTETRGLPLLRQEISRLYSQVPAGNILCCSGAGEGNYFSLQALVSPGDHVIVFTPCYQSLEELPKAFGAEVTRIPLEENLNWGFDLNKVKEAFKKNTRLVILNYPHNPTGSLPDKETYFALIELARRHGAYIFSDEVYRFLELDESKRLPSMADCYEKGISVSVMTKAFGLAGLRIGWVAATDEAFLKKAANIKHYLSICSSAPSEILALISLRAKNKILDRNYSIMRTNLAILKPFFERHQDLISWKPPVAGCIGFPKLNLPVDIDEFAEELRHEEGVLLLPGSIFNYPGPFFRIGFGRRNMPEALERFERFILKKARQI